MKSYWDSLTPRRKSYTVAAAVALVSLAAGYGLAKLGNAHSEKPGSKSSGECAEVLYWYDPMVPDQHFDKPGKSPFMDMALVPKCAGEEKGAGGVRIDPALVQNFGVRTAEAEYGVLEPETTVTGTIAYNGRDVAIVQPRTAGYVQRTYDRAPDDIVSRGAPLVDLLVPEWGGAQREFLAVAATGDASLTQAARERMRLLGMPDSIISAVARSGTPQSTITIAAPVTGAVTMLDVRPGMTVAAGQTLAEISGIDPVWLEAAVPEALAGDIRVGQPVSATLTAYPGERFAGRIVTVLPSAEMQSRTITVRAELRNPGFRLKPGMFAQVSLSSTRREAMLVPSEAIIRTGERTLVMIEREKGNYRPAEVRIGREANGRTEVLAGLAAGEKVVASGQFLLDSEASLAGLDVRTIDEAVPGERKSGTKKEDRKEPAIHRTTGTIRKITASKVTLQHDPIPALEWPAMTMSFAAQKPKQLSGFKAGDRVTFSFTNDQRGPRIVSIRKADQ